MATLVLANMPYVKLVLPTKAIDVTAVRGIEGNSVMKVFIKFIFLFEKELCLHLNSHR